jgi:hypothetical protein
MEGLRGEDFCLRATSTDPSPCLSEQNLTEKLPLHFLILRAQDFLLKEEAKFSTRQAAALRRLVTASYF